MVELDINNITLTLSPSDARKLAKQIKQQLQAIRQQDDGLIYYIAENNEILGIKLSKNNTQIWKASSQDSAYAFKFKYRAERMLKRLQDYYGTNRQFTIVQERTMSCLNH